MIVCVLALESFVQSEHFFCLQDSRHSGKHRVVIYVPMILPPEADSESGPVTDLFFLSKFQD